jgi:tetratricopeptide (TPR) repeat protein
VSLLLVMVVVPVLAFQAPGRTGPPRGAAPFRPQNDLRAQNDLRLYLSTAAQYAAGNRAGALREIRQWSVREVARAIAVLRSNQKHLRSGAKDPDDIEFRTVEAAVLMHGQAGILFLQTHNVRAAKLHFDASSEILQWSRKAAAEERNWTTMRRATFKDRPPDPALELTESINPRDFYVALASAALSLGYAEAATPYANQARLEAPLNPVVQLVAGCVASGLAVEKALQHRDGDASRARQAAETAFREAITHDPAAQEARLRLGKLLLDLGRAAEAERLLAEVEAKASDDRHRYLARLFLGRVAERSGRSDDAIRWYRGALEAWPTSQAARFGLAHALEKSSGPGAAREVVGALLDPSRATDGPSDPWFLYPIGPPGLAQAAFNRVWDRTAVP